MTPSQPIVFTHVRIVDGSGAAPYAGEVRVDGTPTENVAIPQNKHALTAIMKDGGFHKAPQAVAA